MATDEVTIALAVVAFVGSIAAAAVPTVLTLRAQARRESEAHSRGLELEKLRQEHELRRDRRAKQYEFNMQEYRERRTACASLILATKSANLMATARYQAERLIHEKSRTAEALAAMNREAEIASTAMVTASQQAERAMEVLAADEDAREVIKLYGALPLAGLMDDPDDKEARQQWRASMRELQQAIFAYLRLSRKKLAVDDASGIE